MNTYNVWRILQNYLLHTWVFLIRNAKGFLTNGFCLIYADINSQVHCSCRTGFSASDGVSNHHLHQTAEGFHFHVEPLSLWQCPHHLSWNLSDHLWNPYYFQYRHFGIFCKRNECVNLCSYIYDERKLLYGQSVTKTNHRTTLWMHISKLLNTIEQILTKTGLTE